jgi:hypothetical protein
MLVHHLLTAICCLEHEKNVFALNVTTVVVFTGYVFNYGSEICWDIVTAIQN